MTEGFAIEDDLEFWHWRTLEVLTLMMTGSFDIEDDWSFDFEDDWKFWLWRTLEVLTLKTTGNFDI